MVFNLNNNHRDIECDNLYLLDSNNQLTNALDLFTSGSSSSGITTLTGSGAAVVTGAGSSRDVFVDLSNYNTIAQIDAKIAADVTQALQSYVTQALLQSTLSSYKLISNSFSQINVAAPLSIASTSSASGTSVTIDSLFKPSSVTASGSSGVVLVANDQTGSLSLFCDGSENRGQVRLVDANSVVRLITASNAGDLVWNGNAVAMASQLAAYQTTLTFNAPLSESAGAVSVDLSNFSTTAQITALLQAKQDVLSATAPLSITANTIAIDLTAYQPISTSFTQLGVVAPLTVSQAPNPSGGVAATFDTLWKPSQVSVGTGLLALSSDQNGTLALSLTGLESRSSLKLSDPQGTIRDLTSTNAGALTFDGTALQPALAYYSETTANTNPGQYQYGPTNTPVWVNPYYTNNGSASQNITYQVYLSIGGTTLSRAYMWSVDLKSDNNTTPEILVTVGDGTTYNYGKIFQLTDAWQTIQLPWFGMSTNAANLHLGYDAPSLGLTQPGGVGIQVQLRNFAIYEVGSSPNVAISQQLSVASDVRIAGSIINTSDKRLKTDIETLDPATAMSILKSVEPKTYERTDGQTGRRAGFLADDIHLACLHNELYVGNIVSRTGDGQYLGLDYARLVSILWSCCKTLDSRVQALEAAQQPS